MIDLLIPTYGRAHKIADIHANVKASMSSYYYLWFVVEADDTDTLSAVYAEGLVPIINDRTRSYSGAINKGYLGTAGQYVFAGADDLEFTPAWDQIALARMQNDVMVVGTNDRYNPSVLSGVHATHYLVNRDYLDKVGGCVDEGPKSFLWEGYTHNYCDTEFIATARHRGVFVPCLDSVVKHLHWSIGLSEKDATSVKGQESFWQDDAKYNARSHMWT